MRDIYLIDFENVASEGLSGITYLAPEDEVIIFYSSNSNRLSMKMHILIGKSVCRLDYFEATVGGKNALDHQISTWLGYLIGTGAAERNYYIVSRDMGYKFVASFWSESERKSNVYCVETIRAAGRIVRPVKEAAVKEVPETAAPEAAAKEAPQAPVIAAAAVQAAPAVPAPEPPEVLEPEEDMESKPEDRPKTYRGRQRYRRNKTRPRIVLETPEAPAVRLPDEAETEEADEFTESSEPSQPVSAAPETLIVAEPKRETPQPAAAEPKAELPKPVVVESKPELPKPVVAEPKPELPKPVVAEPKPELPKPAVAEPKAELPKPVITEPKTEAPKPVAAEPKAELPKPAIAESKIEAPKPVAAEPKPEQPKREPNFYFHQPAIKPQRENRAEKNEPSKPAEERRPAPQRESKPEQKSEAKPEAKKPEPKKQETKKPEPKKQEAKKPEAKSQKPKAEPKRNLELGAILAPYPDVQESLLRELIAANKRQVLCNTLRKQLGQEKGLALYNEIKKSAWR